MEAVAEAEAGNFPKLEVEAEAEAEAEAAKKSLLPDALASLLVSNIRNSVSVSVFAFSEQIRRRNRRFEKL